MKELTFTSLNVDDEYRNWDLTLDELKERYFSEECDLPSNDDTICDFKINGTPMHFNIFMDIIEAFGINKEVQEK